RGEPNGNSMRCHTKCLHEILPLLVVKLSMNVMLAGFALRHQEKGRAKPYFFNSAINVAADLALG
ncbi:MAG: hypothetical protein VB875_10670, partial [Pirellulales bacterium]